MTFHYTRENGSDGQILVEDGRPPGEPFSRLLDQGPVDVRAALECISYLADILSIAEEDDTIHGDLKPGYVFVDDTGSVHIAGYGEARRGGRAPEGRAVSIASDVYGLGLILISLLTTDSVGIIPRESELHDGLMVEKLRQIDWQELADRKWQEKVLHFLCSMLSFAPEDRPDALDVANVLGQASENLQGLSLSQWAISVIEPSTVSMPPTSLADAEDLSGAHRLAPSPAVSSPPEPRQAARSKGESTAFWSRQKIDEMLRESSMDGSPAHYTAPEESQLQAPPGRMPTQIPELPDATLSASSATIEAIKEEVRNRPTAAAVPSPPAAVPPRPDIVYVPPAASRPPVVAPIASASVPPVARAVPPSLPSGYAPVEPEAAPQRRIKPGLLVGFGIGIMFILGGGMGVFLNAVWERDERRDRDEDREEDDRDDRDDREDVASQEEEADSTDLSAEAGQEEELNVSDDELDIQDESAPSSAGGSAGSSGSGQGRGGGSGSGGGSGGSGSGSVSTGGGGPAVPVVVDSTIGVAEVSLSFAGADAAYFCTPGNIAGEFNSSVVFILDTAEHYYDGAISTCVVQIGDNFRKRGQGEFKGSFSVIGLGMKSYQCAVVDGAMGCSGG